MKMTATQNIDYFVYVFVEHHKSTNHIVFRRNYSEYKIGMDDHRRSSSVKHVRTEV